MSQIPTVITGFLGGRHDGPGILAHISPTPSRLYPVSSRGTTFAALEVASALVHVAAPVGAHGCCLCAPACPHVNEALEIPVIRSKQHDLLLALGVRGIACSIRVTIVQVGDDLAEDLI
jgi:hypothetical protein